MLKGQQKRVIGRIRYLNANIVYLLETRVKENKCQLIVDKHFEGWRCFQNYNSAIKRRI